ncbi:beta-N-acetylhexosaminidase [Rhizobium sp. SG_E_25_P2]|uniref:glycoside hydrolase family 3 protein n=1 Tax=Rhizobium sp. SG_E_25_P2 TaxID=2879942 RepID=UPI00247694E5|nr:glycoside hydrolase family 3 N-terminal domain-containing protein [Rhizobium sp. SG_E_25_P2]MDH6265263.1 beta-N-acetylhexosaminidase [Rhizobium sp. SG_E_25_P2]
MSIYENLRKPPFSLDDRAVDWVRKTYDGLTLEERVGQIFVLIMMGRNEEEFARIRALKPGGVTRFFTPDFDYERRVLTEMNEAVAAPLIITADLEGSRYSFSFGTPVLGQLGLAAVDDVEATRKSAEILATEARALGVTWSFTPVIDINAAFRSAIVGTRSYGSDVDRIERHALAHIQGLQANGVAATVKHWPGEGFDDRDQHLVTTINPLSLDEWQASFGRLYRRMFDEGVLSVMSAHIAFPAYVRSKMPDAGLEAFRPASVSPLLNQTLLRDELGFNGLIVSDATSMGGLSAWGQDRITKPEIIASGCDVILFSDDPERDMAAVKEAVISGQISQTRLQDAVCRMLGLKAKLGLFEKSDVFPPVETAKAAFAKPDNVEVAQTYIARSPTLVKDVQSLFPLSVETHKRILLVDGGIVHPLMPETPPLILPELLRQEGFEVTIDRPDIKPTGGDYDLVLYALAEESLLIRGHIFLDWRKLAGGNLYRAMHRTWTHLPTAIISFGHPYYLYDAPRVPALINAYSSMDPVQRAVVNCMMGRAAFNRTSPVDAFCGLEDAHY